MHPFIHPLTSAADPAWEARTDWDIFKGLAKKFSEVAPEVLGLEKDVVLVPILHDTAGEMAQALDVKDWKQGETEAIPGRTMPNIAPNNIEETAAEEMLSDDLPEPAPLTDQPLEMPPPPTVTPTPSPRRAPALPDSGLEGTITLDIDPQTGLIAVESCPVIRTKTFVLGTEPKKYCGPDYHKRKTIEPAAPPGRPRVVGTPQP
jgi:hypothetical protein